MYKSIVTYLLGISALVFITSCKKDSSSLDSVLFGTWNVTKVQGQFYTNGTPGLLLADTSPTGYVRFDSDGTGEQNYSFTLLGTSYPNVNDFVWESNDNEIIIKRYGQPDLIWVRITNTAHKQEATYTSVISSTQTLDYTLTLEK